MLPSHRKQPSQVYWPGSEATLQIIDPATWPSILFS